MVEDVEEGILSAVAGQVLDVIHDENIHFHIECEKIRETVVHICIHILGLEPVGRNIEHYELRKTLFHSQTYCLSYVSLAQPRSSEEEERVEGRFAGSCRNVQTCIYAHLVALPLYEIVETVNRVKLRVNLNSLQARVNKCTGTGSA